jgi:hypothetical protein
MSWIIWGIHQPWLIRQWWRILFPIGLAANKCFKQPKKT